MTQISLLVRLTWSKITAFILFAGALFEDIYSDLDGKMLMFAIPFIVILITGKQIIDYKEQKNGNTDKN